MYTNNEQNKEYTGSFRYWVNNSHEPGLILAGITLCIFSILKCAGIVHFNRDLCKDLYSDDIE